MTACGITSITLSDLSCSRSAWRLPGRSWTRRMEERRMVSAMRQTAIPMVGSRLIGNLVFEIVCKFRVTQADAVASCPSTYQTPIHLPPIGSHVRIVGSYVQDTNHGKWMEIHPVTSIEIIPDP